jgi:hypothetical protein
MGSKSESSQRIFAVKFIDIYLLTFTGKSATHAKVTIRKSFAFGGIPDIKIRMHAMIKRNIPAYVDGSNKK